MIEKQVFRDPKELERLDQLQPKTKGYHIAVEIAQGEFGFDPLMRAAMNEIKWVLWSRLHPLEKKESMEFSKWRNEERLKKEVAK